MSVTVPHPLVTVVIPTRNRVHLLRQAIDSVLAQDYPALECIVADAASGDGTIELLQSYGDRIHWSSEPDAGPFEAIEKAWAGASGAYLTWLNDDDLLLPGGIAALVAAFTASPAASVAYGAALGIDASGRVIWWEAARPWSLRRAILEADHVINQPAALIRREAAFAAGGLERDWVHDHDLWIRIAVNGGRFTRTPKTIAAVRIFARNHSMEPRFAIDQKRRLVERWLANPAVPGRIRRHRRRARSNVYLRGLHYLDPRRSSHWLLGLRWFAAAIATDPLNAPHAIARVTRLASALLLRRHRLRGHGFPRAL